jgi:hypothetical protein
MISEDLVLREINRWSNINTIESFEPVYNR